MTIHSQILVKLDEIQRLADAATPDVIGYAGLLKTKTGLVGVNGPTCPAGETADSVFFRAARAIVPAQVAALREAIDVLEMYSSREFYQRKGTLAGGTGPDARGAQWIEEPSAADKDCGNRARKALARIQAILAGKGGG